MRAISGWMMPQRMVKSLHSEPSPAMFPRAQTAWSTTLWSVEERSWINIGTAPASTTVLVWWDEPEAMLVRAHAASNCSFVLRRMGGQSGSERWEEDQPKVVILHTLKCFFTKTRMLLLSLSYIQTLSLCSMNITTHFSDLPSNSANLGTIPLLMWGEYTAVTLAHYIQQYLMWGNILATPTQCAYS